MTAPGWYRDPDGQPGTERWWDGAQWGARRAAPPPPGPMGYPPLGAPPAFTPTPQTSGSAIGSLVLAILWLGGIGSIIAVFLGVHAKREIRQANGAVGGDGVATGGVIVGILGILGAIATWAIVISLAVAVHHDIEQIPHDFGTTTVTVGQTATLEGVDDGGITSVTVESLTPTSGASDEALQEYVASVKVCAGGDGSTGAPNTDDFTVQLSEGASTVADPSAPTSPQIDDQGPLGAGQCGTGNVGFGVPSDEGHPIAVVYQPALRTLRWTVPGS